MNGNMLPMFVIGIVAVIASLVIIVKIVAVVRYFGTKKSAKTSVKGARMNLVKKLDEALSSRNLGMMEGVIKVAGLRIPELRLQNDQEIIDKRDALVMKITEMKARRPQQHHRSQS